MAKYVRGTARSTASMNDELEKIQNSLADKLDRDPSSGEPNQMETNIDMNSNRVINVPTPTSPTEVASKSYVDAVLNLALALSGVQAVTPVEQARATGDGVTTTYDSPASALQLATSFFVFLDGVRQRPTTDYSVDASGNIVFVTAPSSGVLVDITFFEPQIA
jgi:hypothetical protein